jgi:hypothetical protein
MNEDHNDRVARFARLDDEEEKFYAWVASEKKKMQRIDRIFYGALGLMLFFATGAIFLGVLERAGRCAAAF